MIQTRALIVAIACIGGSVLIPGCCNKDLGGSSAPSTPDEKAAVSAAESWLKLIDDGKYDDSWDQAATYFRNAMPKAQWSTTVAGVRKPLGKLTSRRVKSVTSTKTVPGAPDGEYVIIQFDTSYASKKEAVETVTPMKDGGAWKVSGYYIR